MSEPADARGKSGQWEVTLIRGTCRGFLRSAEGCGGRSLTLGGVHGPEGVGGCDRDSDGRDAAGDVCRGPWGDPGREDGEAGQRGAASGADCHAAAQNDSGGGGACGSRSHDGGRLRGHSRAPGDVREGGSDGCQSGGPSGTAVRISGGGRGRARGVNGSGRRSRWEYSPGSEVSGSTSSTCNVLLVPDRRAPSRMPQSCRSEALQQLPASDISSAVVLSSSSELPE